MYIRFVVPERDVLTGVETGFFEGVFAIKYREHETADWLRSEVVRELDWFNDNLDTPDRLTRRRGRHGSIRGVCWFRPEAKEAISRAHYVCWLLEEAGIPVRKVRRQHPGEIIWRDHMQIVARPTRGHPVAFR